MSDSVAPQSPDELDADRVLIVDDDPAVSRIFEYILTARGYDVTTAQDGSAARVELARSDFDVIISDISMPGVDGIELLRTLRERDLDVPVVLVTGKPGLDTAMRAIEYGAFRYLLKPVALKDLLQHVSEAAQLHRLARVKRRAVELAGDGAREASDRAALAASFGRALDRLWMAYQPIVSLRASKVRAYEAFVRSRDAALGHPGALLDAAERVDQVHRLGRRVRAAVADVVPTLPSDETVYVNLHPADLDDEELYDPQAPLTRFAPRVVLEITERARLEPSSWLHQNLADLRNLGYRIAIDDLGAGYAGLHSFLSIHPEIVKIDMVLTRGVDSDRTRQNLILSVLTACRELGIEVIVEGVETHDERDVLRDMGVDLVQGFLFATPGESLTESSSFVV